MNNNEEYDNLMLEQAIIETKEQLKKEIDEELSELENEFFKELEGPQITEAEIYSAYGGTREGYVRIMAQKMASMEIENQKKPVKKNNLRAKRKAQRQAKKKNR